MKKLTAEQIQTNWNTLIEIIDSYIGDGRRDNLLKMYDDFKDRMMFAPASAKDAFHTRCRVDMLNTFFTLWRTLYNLKSYGRRMEQRLTSQMRS